MKLFAEGSKCSIKPYMPSFLDKETSTNISKVARDWREFSRDCVSRRITELVRASEFLEALPPSAAENYRTDILNALSRLLQECYVSCHKMANTSLSQAPKSKISHARPILDLPPGGLYHYLTLYSRTFRVEEFLLQLPLPIDFLTDELEEGLNICGFNIASLLTVTAKTSPAALWHHLVINNTCRQQNWHWLACVLMDIGLVCLNYQGDLFENAECRCRRSTELAYKAVRSRPLMLKQLARLAIRNCMKDVDVVTDCYKLPLKKELQDYVSLRCLNASIRPWLLGEVQGHFCYKSTFALIERYNLEISPCVCMMPLTSDSDSDASPSKKASLIN